jgi:hypothetical protein
MLRNSGGEHIKSLMDGKCKAGSVEFKLGLAELQIDELYSIFQLGQEQFENTWGHAVGLFLTSFPEEVLVANIYKARGKTVDEVLQILKDYFGPIGLDRDSLSKYFFYFFETHNLTAHDLKHFIDKQDDEIFKLRYELIFSKDEEKIPFVFDQKKFASLPEKLSMTEFYRMDDKVDAVRNGKPLPFGFDKEVLSFLKGNVNIITQVNNYNPLNLAPGNPSPPEIENNAHIFYCGERLEFINPEEPKNYKSPFPSILVILSNNFAKLDLSAPKEKQC